MRAQEISKLEALHGENSDDNDAIGVSFSSAETLSDDWDGELSADDRKVLDRIADDLARLGRAKRVGLGVKDKGNFIKVWTRTRKVW